MIVVTTTDSNGKQAEFNGSDAEIEVRKTHPDYIDLSFTTPKGEKVLVSFARLLLLDPETRDEIREASQHTSLFNATTSSSGARD